MSARSCRGVRGLLLAVALVVGVTACSSYPGDLSGGSSGSDEAGADGLRRVRVSDTAGMPAAFLQYGVQRGFFRAQGLNLQVQTSAGGAAAIPALINGGLDVAGSNAVSAITAMNRGLPLAMVGSGTSTSTDPGQDFSGILVPADSPIRTTRDLAGKRIAVNTLRNINEIVIDASMRKTGGSLQGMKLVEMGFPDMAPAVERKDVDAAMMIEPFLSAGKGAGMREIARPYTDARPGLQIGTYLMAMKKAREDHELVTAFQAGARRTAMEIQRDPAAFRAELPKIAGMSPKVAQGIHLPSWKGTTDRASIELIASGMRRLGLTDKPFDYEKSVLK